MILSVDEIRNMTIHIMFNGTIQGTKNVCVHNLFELASCRLVNL